jgi:asparagine synthase (glutamine-hydrolysing)
MCGINGVFYFNPARRAEREDVDSMRAALDHRGPDDRGIHLDGNVGLGFNRLSIIDLSGGHQPMCNEDGTVWIVFNGEIYNFVELREDLLSRGHRFQTRSDTETIVHAWEEYGERCPEKLRGMFAFAIWDSRRKVLFCARDRLGIKPFFYYQDSRQFLFASEMKAVIEPAGVPREVDPEALAQFLRHLYVIGPRTMLRGVCKLLPGHSITVEQSGSTIRRYWELPIEPPREVSEHDALEEFDALIKETIRRHLVSDVPLGAFLSGGIDSSSVVALMASLQVPDIKTFSVGYDSPESELPFARIVAGHFHTDHNELILSPSKFRDSLLQTVWYMDEPVADWAALPLFFVSRLARTKVTVALSGEGSDEIFGGYEIYRRMLTIRSLGRIPLASLAGRMMDRFSSDEKIRKYARMLGQSLESSYGGVSHAFSHEQISRLLLSRDWTREAADGVSQAYAECRGLPDYCRMSFIDIKTWLVDNLLVKADRMSMGNSLELRVPFLDHKVVEFAWRLPVSLKIRGGTGKYLLRKYMEPLLPSTITQRPKKGFAVPIDEWFRGDLAGFVRETLHASGGGSHNFFSWPEIERLLDTHRRKDCSEQIYALLVFDSWYRAFVKSGVPAGAP